MIELRDDDWEVLLDSIGQGNCIVLLGPDLSVGGGTGRRRNLLSALSRTLAERLESEYDRTVPDPENLPQVAQRYVLETGTADYAQSAAARFYEKQTENVANDPVFEALAALPVPLFVTSRHDATLDHFLAQAGKEPVAARYHFRGDNERRVDLGCVDGPLVYRLFGWTKERSSLVLTESDLLDFLVAAVSKDPRIPDNLQNELTSPDKSFLFLGFGLRYWHLRILLHIFRIGSSRKRSFALERGLDDRSTILFYSLGYRTIRLLDTDPGEFIVELGRRCKAQQVRSTAGDMTPASVQTRDADAPTVFVSYVKEDDDKAQWVFDTLRKAGLEPWMDEENLRVGERWDPELEQSISRCDYFVVLQSKALQARDESYVYKEVEIALEKQSRQRRGLVFILPVRIDDVTFGDGRPGCLEDLAQLQTRDLLDEKDMNKLLSQIARDQQKRVKRA